MEEQIRVLHVDDDPALLDMTSQFLGQVADDIVVSTETTPRDALDRLRSEPFDCVLSDYQMPGTNGLELLDTIREGHPDLPFILYTGKGSEEIASEAISRGVTDYLQKAGGTDHYERLAYRIETAVSSYRAKRHAEREGKRRTTLFENATDPILDVAIDPDRSEVLAVNDAFEATFGYEGDAIRGQDAAELLVPDEDRDRHETLKARLLNDEPVEAEVQRETADGLRDFLVRAIPYEGAGGQKGAYAWYVDVTEQRERQRLLKQLHDATRELMAAETKREIADLAADALHEHFGYWTVGVRLLDETGERLEMVTIATDAPAAERTPPPYEVGEGFVGEAFERGEVSVVELADVDGQFDYDPARKALLLPLGNHGMMNVGEPDPDAFADWELEFCRLFAATVEAAMSRVERAP